MLSELVVEELGPIARAEIVLRAGSSALTGETGAGKTLLVTAVTLLTGGRAERGIVRDGASEARIEGRFVVPADDPVVAMLEARDLLVEASDPVEIVITRTVSGGGSRGRVNGRLVPAAVLSELGGALVEIAGQHEHHRLSSPRAQRGVLDRYAGAVAVGLAGEVAEMVRDLTRAVRELDDLRASERERARELAVLRFEIDELEAASIEPGEIASLQSDAERLENAESLGGASLAAIDELVGEGGVDEALARAAASLDRARGHDPALGALADRVATVAGEVRDIGADLAARVQEPDPAALERVRDWLGELARLRRKYGDDEGELLSYLERARARAEELAHQNESVGELELKVERLRDRARDKATELSSLRADAAPRLAAATEALLHDLAMPGASFTIDVAPVDLHEGGVDSVTFLVATGPGEKPRPMTKIASGGELSRIALALHLLAREAASVTTIFDEVDAGVGGAAARAVGEALASLGRDGSQVLVVTHLPQVAAFADSHFRVVRRDGRRREVVVEPVEGTERVEELSRMLAGLPESDTAREHAQELLDLAAAGGSR